MNSHSSDIEFLLYQLLTEKKLAYKMELERSFRTAIGKRTLPILNGRKAIFLWEGAAKSVNIIGDWTQWRKQLVMTRIPSTSWFYYTEEFPDNARLQYKFVIDGTAWENDPRNPNFSQEGFGTNSECIMPNYLDESWLQPKDIIDKPLQRGEIVTLVIESSVLDDKREVMLYLPHRYSPKQSLSNNNVDKEQTTETDTYGNKSAQRIKRNSQQAILQQSERENCYPLLIMHDGAESLSLGKFHHILDHLIHAEGITPCVGVFIAPNLPKRNEEYTLNPKYLEFCTKEALPKALEEAAKRGYLISPVPLQRCIGGASLGGLLATYMAFHTPEEFGVFFAQSPAYWWERGVIFSEDNMSRTENLHAILQTGTIADAHALTLRMKQELEKRGVPLYYREYAQGHTWGNWRSGFARGMMDWNALMQAGQPL